MATNQSWTKGNEKEKSTRETRTRRVGIARKVSAKLVVFLDFDLEGATRSPPWEIGDEEHRHSLFGCYIIRRKEQKRGNFHE